MSVDVPSFSQNERNKEHALFLQNIRDNGSMNILVIGERCVGKTSVINSAAMAITGRYQYVHVSTLHPEGMHGITFRLNRYTPNEYCQEGMEFINHEILKNLPVFIETMDFDDKLSNAVVQANMGRNSDGTDATRTTTDVRYLSEYMNSTLMKYILKGRFPNEFNFLDFGKMVIHGQLEKLEKLDDFQENEERKADAVVIIIPRGCKNLPKKLLNTIKQEAQRGDINVPVFGVMTKMDKRELDGDKKWRDLAREFQAELGIDGNFFVPLINYVYEDLLEDEPETNPNTDVPLLKMLNQIYQTKAKKINIEKKEKELKEKFEKERKFGWCFYLLIGVIVLLILAVLGFMVSTKLRSSSLNESFSTPKQDTIPPKKEL